MASVEEISMSLVREFLNRKGLKTTLQSMDMECPRTVDSINSRTLLCKALHVERLFRRNKELTTPFKTIIEVIVGYFIDKGKKSHEVASDNAMKEKETYQDTALKSDTIITNQTVLSNNKIVQLTAKINVEDSQPQALRLGTDYEKLLQDEKSVASNSTVPVEHQEVHYDGHRSSSYDTTASSTSKEVTPSLTSQYGRRPKQVRVNRTIQPIIAGGSSRSKKVKPLRISHKLKERTEEEKERVKEDLTIKQSPVKMMPVHSLATSPVTVIDEKKLIHECTNTTTITTHSLTSKEAKLHDVAMEMTLEDISDSDVQHLSIRAIGGLIRQSKQEVVGGRLVTRETSKKLRNLLFGSSKGYFNAEWIGQNFIFSSAPGLEYGLVQHKGGPCGVLATVQAYILKHLLFTSGSSDDTSVKDRNRSLISAMVDILWKVKSDDSVVLALPSIQHSSSLTADVIDQLVLYDKEGKDDVMDFLQHNLTYFTGAGQPGCILLLISTILTRGIQRIVDDMDEPTNKLIGRHNYCTQDLVNLFLVGRAVSNTHNGIISLGTGNEITQLKGLHCQSEIGFLSLFEHYKSCTVGSHYKQPRYPIWVVCSESHFSVLFAASSDDFTRTPAQFDLIYYNGLGEQDEEIRLTIDTTHKVQCTSEEDDDFVPPLELCIRTCWNEAHIDWNGTSPLL